MQNLHLGYFMAVNTTPANVPAKTRFTDYIDTQERLPYWARSTNPIVRRHLGLYWRTVPPEIQPFIWIFMTWAGLMLLGFLIPPFFSLTMISFLAAIMIIPFAMALYAHVLVSVAVSSSDAMQQEFSNNTFQLLQATPMSLSQIFLGKVAASMWKRMDDIVMIAQLALAFSPPMFYAMYAQLWLNNPNENLIVPILTLIAGIVTVLRIFLEPIMIGVVSVFIGMVVPGKGRSISAAVVVGSFYFLLINLLSRLPAVRGFDTPEGPVPANGTLVILTDLVLPVLIPIVVIFGILKLAEIMLAQD
ncbi:MAG: hypothetical protein Phog2KO_40550 [Phototrophicaceae bacterium]